MILLLCRACLIVAVGLVGPLFGQAPAPAAAPGALRLIGMRTIPSRQVFQQTAVGGLSGLDYDAASDTWITVSDDKSEAGPARYYTLKLDYDATGFPAAEVTGVTALKQPDGSNYPDKAHALAGGGDVPDFESIRLDPQDGSVWYTSEGDRGKRMQPFLRHAARDGRFLGELPPPPMFKVSRDHETGPRQNLIFEGLTFATDGQSLWTAMEGPRYEDGPSPTTTAGAFTRITHYDRAGKILGQFAYPVDAIPVPLVTGRWNDNGVTEMLAINDHEFLLLERCAVQTADGGSRFYIRLYVVDVAGATDVSGQPALVGAVFAPVKKRLLLDFTRLTGVPAADNLECLAWGRRLPNGHATLVVAADDNFNPAEQTQLWVFEVLPATVTP